MFNNQPPKNKQLEAIIALGSDKRVVADGPLSEIYHKTLNKLYAKELDPETGVSLESQVNDAITESTWMSAVNSMQRPLPNGEAVGMLYGVKKSEAGVSDVVRISDALSEMTPAQKENSGIVFDTAITAPDNGSAPVIRQSGASVFEQAIESIAELHSVGIYTSLESFIVGRKKAA